MKYILLSFLFLTGCTAVSVDARKDGVQKIKSNAEAMCRCSGGIRYLRITHYRYEMPSAVVMCLDMPQEYTVSGYEKLEVIGCE